MYNYFDTMLYCRNNNYKYPKLASCTTGDTFEFPSDADGEVSLDIDVIAGVAQGCTIITVFAPNSDQGFINGLLKCMSFNPDAISVSWGGPLSTWSSSTATKIDSILKKAHDLGISVYCASGDDGSSDGLEGNNVDYPACSPWAIACGGTHLEINKDGSRLSETSWSDSGGGISPTGRKSPDISGNADPETGYEISIDFMPNTIGGTSAVAPLYAAYQCILNAKAGKRVTDMKSKFYASPECFYDIIIGSNGTYQAGPGIDEVTGLGVLDGLKFIQKYAK